MKKQFSSRTKRIKNAKESRRSLYSVILCGSYGTYGENVLNGLKKTLNKANFTKAYLVKDLKDFEHLERNFHKSIAAMRWGDTIVLLFLSGVDNQGVGKELNAICEDTPEKNLPENERRACRDKSIILDERDSNGQSSLSSLNFEMPDLTKEGSPECGKIRVAEFDYENYPSMNSKVIKFLDDKFRTFLEFEKEGDDSKTDYFIGGGESSKLKRDINSMFPKKKTN